MRALALAMGSILALGLGSCGDEPKKQLPVGDYESYDWAERQGFAGNNEAERGAEIFVQVGCLNCHTYLGDGTRNVGAPDLTAIGRENPRSPERYAAYVSNPSKFGNEVMPRFRDLGRRNLLALGAFLEASKGER